MNFLRIFGGNTPPREGVTPPPGIQRDPSFLSNPVLDLCTPRPRVFAFLLLLYFFSSSRVSGRDFRSLQPPPGSPSKQRSPLTHHCMFYCPPPPLLSSPNPPPPPMVPREISIPCHCTLHPFPVPRCCCSAWGGGGKNLPGPDPPPRKPRGSWLVGS